MIGLKEIHDMFKRALKERGEDTIAVCLYRDNGKPECIVGQVCDYVDPEYAPKESETAEYVLAHLPAQVSRDATQFATKMQCMQDCGETWGTAMKKSEAEFRDKLKEVGAEFYYPQ